MRPAKLKTPTMSTNESFYTFHLSQSAYDRVQICTVITDGTANSSDKLTVEGVDEDGDAYQLTDVHGATGGFSLDSPNNLCLVFECHFPAVRVTWDKGNATGVVFKCRSYSTANPQPSANRAFDTTDVALSGSPPRGSGHLKTEY